MKRLLVLSLLLSACSSQPSADPATDSDADAGTFDTFSDAQSDAGTDAPTADVLDDSRDDADAASDATRDVDARADTFGDTARDADNDTANDTRADVPGDAVEDVPRDTPGPDLSGDVGEEDELRIDLRDIWGRRLVIGECSIRTASDVVSTVNATVLFHFPTGDTGTVECWADDHRDASLTIERLVDGSVGVAREDVTAQTGVAYYRGADTLFIGLPHAWFASTGRTPSDGNRVRLLMDGEETWELVSERIDAATESIHAASWWWESDFELIRPNEILSESARRQYQVMERLEASSATKRVMIWGHSLASFLNVDDELEGHGEIPRDDFEFMTQENPSTGAFPWELAPAAFGDALSDEIGVTESLLDELPIEHTGPAYTVDISDFPFGFDAPIASYHQKLWVFDGDEAIVSGMNVKLTDWDSSDHLVFDHRRMDFGSSASDRQDVIDHESEPDSGPRKDYAAYVEGPVASDVQDLFASRWNYLIDEGAEYSWNASEIRTRPVPTVSGGVQAQVVATMPEPFYEYSILESHLNAVSNASQYIFIEDQYWRAPLLVDAIVDRMTAVPDLVLIVVTKPVSEFTDPGCYWTHETNQRLESAFGSRYRTYQLRAFDTEISWGFDETDAVFLNMDVHSKIMLVDDVFLSVGSCNKNNRGYVYEGESNLNVFDPTWVREQRERIVSNLLGLTFTPDDWLAELQRGTDRNDDVWDAWDDEGFDLDLDGDPLPFAYQPRGFLYSLEFAEPSDCLIEPIGPDVSSHEPDEKP